MKPDHRNGSHSMLSAILLGFFLLLACQSIVEAKELSVDTIWNKPADTYAQGDRFSVEIVPRSPSYLYMFYVDDKDGIISIYPSRLGKEKPVSPDKPLKIEKLESYVMKVDSRKGKIIFAALRSTRKGAALKETLLGERDWTSDKEDLHSLKLSGKKMLERLEDLKGENPEDVYFSVEDAPRAKEAS